MRWKTDRPSHHSSMKNTKIDYCAQLALASALITLTACEGSHGGSAADTVTNGPAVAFTGSAQLAPEAGGTVLVGVVLSAVSTEPVTVPFGVAGSATELADFTIDPSPLVVPAGQTTAEIVIVVVDDALH